MSFAFACCSCSAIDDMIQSPISSDNPKRFPKYGSTDRAIQISRLVLSVALVRDPRDLARRRCERPIAKDDNVSTRWMPTPPARYRDLSVVVQCDDCTLQCASLCACGFERKKVDGEERLVTLQRRQDLSLQFSRASAHDIIPLLGDDLKTLSAFLASSHFAEAPPRAGFCHFAEPAPRAGF
jgi:hypothetical protein